MAKRFQFRLQTVLEVRQLHEREAKRRVAAKHAEIAVLDRLNAQTAEEIAEQQAALAAAQADALLDPISLTRGRAWIAHLRKSIATRQVQKAGLLEELQQFQAQLRDARTQTRIIEKLRERRWGAYLHERDREEQHTAEELAQQLHQRNHRDAEAQRVDFSF